MEKNIIIKVNNDCNIGAILLILKNVENIISIEDIKLFNSEECAFNLIENRLIIFWSMNKNSLILNKDDDMMYLKIISNEVLNLELDKDNKMCSISDQIGELINLDIINIINE